MEKTQWFRIDCQTKRAGQKKKIPISIIYKIATKVKRAPVIRVNSLCLCVCMCGKREALYQQVCRVKTEAVCMICTYDCACKLYCMCHIDPFWPLVTLA